MSGSVGRARRWVSAFTAGVLALGGALLVVATPLAPAPEAAAAPGNPGVPGDPPLLYAEDFENSPDGSNTLLPQYTSAQGVTYSAAAFWANRANCNGFIVDWTSPRNAADCTDVPNAALVYNNMLAIPHALGQLRGVEPTTNGAAASYTADGATGAQIQFQTSQIDLPVANRFVTFSVDAGAMNCSVSAPLLRFYLLDSAGSEIPVSSSPINVCTDSRGTTYTGVPTPDGADQTVRAGTFAANGSTLVTGPSLAVRMRNQNSVANGNDGAYDNIEVLDVTPQLDKEFSPTSTIVGGRSTLTFTITNTSELAGKDGWEFTDNLPEGLEVAGPADLETDCDADVAVSAGGSTVAVTNGVLASGETSCTISVDVTSRIAGSYDNGPDDFFPTTGMDLPAEATVTFTPFVGSGVCPAPAFLFQGSPSATPTEIDLVTGDLVDQPALSDLAFNGAGYSELADAFFGFDNPTDQVHLVSPDYTTVQNLGSPDYSNVSFTYDQLFPSGIAIGDVSPDGVLYASSGGSGNRPWMAVDVDQSSPTFLQVLDGGTVPAPAAPINAGLDWVYNSADGRLYSFGTNSNNIFIYAFDPANPSDGFVQVAALGALAAPNGETASAGGSAFGATYASPGYLYGANNQTGQIWRIAADDPTSATFFAYGPGPTTNNDGARCASAEVLMDLGDAPDTYGTSLDEDGARHALIDYDAATNTAPLMLGDENTVDADDDGAPSAAADGDDVAGVDDEGAVDSPVVLSPTAETTVTVTATNDTTESATLAGWFDVDGNGTFDADEISVVSVPASSGSAEYELTAPTGLVPETVARFRLYAGDVADPQPTAAVSGGEVEDHPVLVQGEPLTCDALYAVDSPSPGNIYEVDTTTGDLTVVHQFNPTGGINALGISGDGRYAISHSGTNVFVFDTQTGTTEAFTTAQNVGATHGAVDRSTGVYYYGNVSGTTANVYGFDPATGTDLGQVAAIALPGAPGANGDWAFDTVGNVYLSAGAGSNNVYVAPGPLPATSQPSPVAITGTLLGGVATSTPINGLAVDVEGYMYLGSSTTLYQINPSSGTIVTQPAFTPSGVSVDLASCATPATIEVQKDVVDRRDPDDQFTVSITGGGLVDGLGNTGTTTGTDLGVQDEVGEFGGPVLGLVGETYTVTETAAGTTDLANYTTTWQCVNQIDDSVVAEGEGVTGEFTMPPASADGTGAAVLCTFTNDDLPVPGLDITKTADPAGEVLPGGTVEYTVTVENTGETTYTADDPASFTDDLAEVLDDATYAGDAVADVGEVAYAEPELSWSGALEPGAVATITYSVTVNDPLTGDGTLTNAVVGPPESNCVDGTEEGCTAVVPVRALLIEKTSEPTDQVFPGSTVEYTVTVTNTGQVEYTDDDPATFTDDLSEVLDDATYADDAAADVGEVTYAEPELSWSGALAPDDVATITYSVTVNDPLSGDGELVNAVTGPPESNCQDGTEEECSTLVPVFALQIDKTTDVTSPAPGEVVTYTITVENIGQVPVTEDAPAVVIDDLTEVLDDATYNGDATADNGDIIEFDPQLWWTPAVDVGESVTMTYSVTVNDPLTGDGVLTNGVLGPEGSNCLDGTEEGCTTDVPVRALEITKTADPAGEVLPGGTVEYTVTVENTGETTYTADDPASFTDDLAEVLDDATYAGDAVADVGEVAYAEPELSWSGALEPGAVATITYSVTVNDPLTGDGTLTNAVVGPPESNCSEGTEEGCTTDVPVRALLVVKSSDSGGETVPDEVVTYTITVENTGQVPYTDADPATLTDDLSGVLDDATFGDVSATVGEASFADPVLSWSGALAPGESAEISYTVTVNDPPTGDGELFNVVVGPEESNCTDAESQDPDCVEPNPVRALVIEKSAAPPGEVLPGDSVEYTVTVENAGQAAYTDADPATFTDDLSEVLDDATYDEDATADAGTVSFTEPTLSWSGALEPGQTATITYSVTVDDPVTGDGVLDNAVVGPEESNCDDGSEDGCHVPVPVRALEISKTADLDEVNPGSTVTYTITVTNTGGVDYTDVDPASFTDDLSEVLDDATYAGDAAADVGAVSYAEPTLSWSGALAPDEIATITYSVTVDDPVAEGGDGILTNTVVGPPESGCDDGTEPGCTTDVPVRALEITKAADPAGEVLPGGTVTYTITVENTGGAAYTAEDQASFTDDLSGVLDDAAYNGDAAADVGAVSFAEPTLSWSGALEPGAVATVTYSVTVNDPVTGDGVLDNAVVGPEESNCDDGSEPGCSTDVPVRALEITKAADPAGEVLPGGTVTYTITVTNTGGADYTDVDPASFTDDLTEVLDDAAYGDDASADVGEVTYAEPTLSWSGALTSGQTATITYSVSVNDPVSGDGTLTNAVVGPPESGCDDGTEPGCTTDVPVRALAITKAADPAGEVLPGGAVTYTVTVTNTGQVPYTAEDPASFTDDLSGVLDDATYAGDAAADVGAVSFADPTLSWFGALEPGEVATVTYSVTVNDPLTGDGTLDNAVVGPPESGCDDGTEPGCTTDVPVRALELVKTSDGAGEALPGDVVTYTVTVENTGQVPYTDADPATFADDLTEVLDDATFNEDASADVGSTSYAEPTLSWSGALAPGDSAEITYSVTVNDPPSGDGTMLNVVVGPPESNCTEATTTDPDCVEPDPVKDLTISKSADPAGEVDAGSTVTYTVTVENTGGVAYTAEDPASFTDDLSSVLDDAAYNGDAAADVGAVTYAEPVLTWSGELEPGATATITYSATVNSPVSGDGTLTNAVVGPQESGCEPGSDDPACSTDVPVRALHLVKTSDGAEGATAGDTVTYTVTAQNTGQVPYTDDAPAAFDDDLSDVLDDATYGDDASADVGTTSYAEPVLSWSGPLEPGETATITYSVTIDDPGTGDDDLFNVVVGPPESNCTDPESDDPDCIEPDPVRDLEIVKTADPAGPVTAGETITYTVAVTSTGTADYTADTPATFTDVMAGVLDDATWNDDVVASTGEATFDADAEELTWAGPLPAGSTATVTYSVTVDDPVAGDGQVANAVLGPPESDCPVAMPAGFGMSVGVATAVPEMPEGCQVVTPVRSFEVSKTVDTDDAAPGDVVTYTVTVASTGTAPYTDDAPATFDDDLSDVLDDATPSGTPSASAGELSFDGQGLSWSGPLEVGGTVTVTYSVRVDEPDDGDGAMVNVVVAPAGSGGHCADDGSCTTTTDVTPPGPVPVPGELPRTGPQWVGALLAAALFLVVAGAVLVRVRRGGRAD